MPVRQPERLRLVKFRPPPSEEVLRLASDPTIVKELLEAIHNEEGTSHIRFLPRKASEQHRHPLSPTFRSLTTDPGIFALLEPTLAMANQVCSFRKILGLVCRPEAGLVGLALCTRIAEFLKRLEKKIDKLNPAEIKIEDFNSGLCVCRIEAAILYFLAGKILVRHLQRPYDSASDDGTGTSADERTDTLSDTCPDTSFGSCSSAFTSLNRDHLGGIWGRCRVKLPAKGGNALGFVAERMRAEPQIRTSLGILNAIYLDISAPYMRMLTNWLHSGCVEDPYSEFLVQTNHPISKDELQLDFCREFWERNWTIRRSNVPPQLEGLEEKILETGKLMAIFGLAGGNDDQEMNAIPASLDSPLIGAMVNTALLRANRLLLDLLLREKKLLARLQSLKIHFLSLLSTDSSGFLEVALPELNKKKKDTNLDTLQSLLKSSYSSIRRGILDPVETNVSLSFGETTLEQTVKAMSFSMHSEPVSQSVRPPSSELKCYSILKLTARIPYPLSIVLDAYAMWRYEMLFRNIFSLRVVEFNLVSTWQNTTNAPIWAALNEKEEPPAWVGSATRLHDRLLRFIGTALNYFVTEVIERHWALFICRFPPVARCVGAPNSEFTTVEDLLRSHQDFLDECLRGCLLDFGDGKLAKVYLKIVQNIESFVNLLHHTIDVKLTEKPKQLQEPAGSEHASFPAVDATYIHVEQVIDRHLKILLQVLEYYSTTYPGYKVLQVMLVDIIAK